jgi:hypothetical protein
MAAFIPLITQVGLQILTLILGKNIDNKQMMELFYKFVERIQTLYLKSAHLSEDAKKRWALLEEKAKAGFQESP